MITPVRALTMSTLCVSIVSALLFLDATKPAALAPQPQVAAVLPTLTLSKKLEATAAFVYDTSERRVLFAQNAEVQLPLASITKLMTALIAREEMESAIVPITAHALARDSAHGLVEGSQWTQEELSNFMLVTSSNDAAQAFADAYDATHGPGAFVSRMNARAQELGMTTFFTTDPTGLDESMSMASTYASARDVAKLMTFIVYTFPDMIHPTVEDTVFASEVRGVTLEGGNTNDALEIPGLLGGKTGFTDLAGGNLAIAFDRGVSQPVVVVVLGSSKPGRFSDVRSLVRSTLSLTSNE